MMLYSTFGTIVMYIGRIFLDRQASLSTLGIYGFFLVITLQVNALWSTFNRAWTPEVFSKFKENRQKALSDIKTMTYFCSFLYLCFFCFFILISKTGILALLIKQEYLTNINIFFILLLGPLFTGIYTISYPLYYYEKKTKVVLLISIILNIADIFLTFFMVKYFNQIGAALSYFLFSAITVFVFALSFKKSMEISQEIITWPSVLFILMIISVFLFLKTSSDILFFAFLAISAFLAYRLGELGKNKHLISEVIKDFKR
jgi:O-antigen/teichoic acid export membrane protein